MIFITLSRWRKKPTKEMLAESSRLWKLGEKEGVKLLAGYSTLGRYDAVAITEAKDEKAVMNFLIQWGDMLSTETLVAVPREEAIKLLEA